MPQNIHLKSFCSNLHKEVYDIFIPIFVLKFHPESPARSPAIVIQDLEANVVYYKNVVWSGNNNSLSRKEPQDTWNLTPTI